MNSSTALHTSPTSSPSEGFRGAKGSSNQISQQKVDQIRHLIVNHPEKLGQNMVIERDSSKAPITILCSRDTAINIMAVARKINVTLPYELLACDESRLSDLQKDVAAAKGLSRV